MPSVEIHPVPGVKDLGYHGVLVILSMPSAPLGKYARELARDAACTTTAEGMRLLQRLVALDLIERMSHERDEPGVHYRLTRLGERCRRKVGMEIREAQRLLKKRSR